MHVKIPVKVFALRNTLGIGAKIVALRQYELAICSVKNAHAYVSMFWHGKNAICECHYDINLHDWDSTSVSHLKCDV